MRDPGPGVEQDVGWERSLSSSLLIDKQSTHSGQQSVSGAAVSLFTIVMGAGIVQVPVQCQRAGLLPAMALCFVCVVVVVWTGIDMASTFTLWNDAERLKMKTFDDLGSRSFGTPGNLLLKVTFVLFLTGLGSVYLLIEARQVQDLLEVFWPAAKTSDYRYVLLAISPVMVTMCMFEDLSALGRATPLAALAALCCIGCIVLQALTAYGVTAGWEDPDAGELRSYVRHEPGLGALDMLGFTTASFLASFAVNSTFPAVMHEMREPRDFRRVLFIVMGCVLALNCLMIGSSWLAYGNFTQAQVTDNMKRLPIDPAEALGDAEWTGVRYAFAARVYNLCMAFNIFVGHPLLQLCSFKTIRGILPEGWMQPGSGRNYATRLAIQALELGVALISPNFCALFGLVAAVCLPLHAVVAPIIFGARIRCRLGLPRRGLLVWAVHTLCLAIAVVVWIFGVRAAIAGVVSSSPMELGQ